jgi:SAM-dependent methyltransferase
MASRATDDVLDAVAAAYWLLLWRPVSDDELAGARRALDAGQTLPELVARLLGSTECRGIIEGTWDERDVGRDIRVTEAAFQTLGDERQFVERTYQTLLGREPDDSGMAYYAERIAGGVWRSSVVQVVVRSPEFRDRYAALCPQSGLIPVDTQLCELANPAKWSNPEWMALLQSLVIVPADRASMHRKGYELTQLLFGLSRLGAVRDDVHVVSVGAGHEPVLYWLANHVARVVATDLYEGAWQAEGSMEGDAVVLADPARYAPFPYRRDRLEFLRMDGTRLEFEDASFDVAYSLSSIEHFGRVDGARRAIAEMARVLRPGGILALATEYCLSGPPHHEAFQPAEVHALLDHPGLDLVAPLDELVWRRYDYRAVDLRVNRHQTPQLVVQDLGTEFTSVMAFLRKRAS